MERLSRPSRRTITFAAAAFALLGVTAGVFQYDRSHPATAASQEQVLLDTRLTWAIPSFNSRLYPVPGPQVTCLWDRHYSSCDEIGPAGNHGETWYGSVRKGELPCPPVFGDGRLYVASDPLTSGPNLSAYDLDRPPVSVTVNYKGGSLNYLERASVWARRWDETIILGIANIPGMAYGDGKLYVAVNRSNFSGGIIAFNGASSSITNSARTGC